MWYEWLYIVLLILGLASSIAVTVLSWIARHSRSGRWLMLVGAGMSILIFSYFMFAVVPSVEQTKFWMQVILTSIHLLPIFFLIFALVYTGRSHWVRWRHLPLVMIFPVFFLTMVWAYPDQVWLSYEIDFSGLVNIWYRTFSFWFTIHAIHNYILISAAFAVLLLHTIRSGPRLRMQTWIINIAFLVPGVVVTLHLLGLSQGLPNLVPIGVGITSTMLLVAFYRSGFLALTPFMHTAIINNMHDAMFVTSDTGVLASINNAARRLMCMGTTDDLVGCFARDVLAPSWAPILRSYLSEDVTEFVHEVKTDGLNQKFEIRVFAVNEDVVDGVRYVYMLREVTDRFRMQTELRRSEEKYRQLVETAHQGMTIMHVNPMKVVFASKPMEKLMGYTVEETLTATEPELISRIYQPDLERAFYNLEGWLQGEFTPPPSMIYRIVRKDGAVRWMGCSSTLIEHEGQIAIQSVYQDVTDTVVAQESLRQMNQRFDGLVRNLPLVVLRFRIVDGHFAFDYLSPRSAEYMGIAADEALHSPELIERLISQQGMQRFLKAYEQAHAQMTTLEWEGVVHYGERQRWAQIMAHPTRQESGVLIWDGFFVDITERKEIEEALRRSQLLLEEAQEIAHLGSWQWDVMSDASFFSDEFRRIYGMDQDSLLNGVESFLPFIHPDDQQIVQDHFNTALASRKSYEFDYRITHPEKGVRVVHASGRFVEDEHGVLQYVLGTLQDITEQKRAEDALAVQNRYLNALHEISLDLLNRRELDDLLQAIVNNLVDILDTPYGRLLLLNDDNELVVRTYTPTLSELADTIVHRDTARLSLKALETLQPVVMGDYQTYPHRSDNYNSLNIGSVACLPVVIADQAIGVLELARVVEKEPYGPDQVQIGMMFSQLAALVIDNANQYSAALLEIADRSLTTNRLNKLTDELRHKNQMEQEQRLLAEALSETSAILNSTLDVDEILRLILETIKPIVPHDSSAIMLIENGVARLAQYSGLPESGFQMNYKVEHVPHLNYMYQTRQHCIIDDVLTYSGWQESSIELNIRSYLAVPIQVEDEVIGFLNIDSAQPSHFTKQDATRLRAFVNHAGVALKNARLYRQSFRLAAIEERQRLARDLHDSVTQTLFSSTILVETIIKLSEKDSPHLRDDLLELRDLSRGALAEMRTMLLELRPDRVVDTLLVDLIDQLTDTLKGRSRIQPHLNLTTESIDDLMNPDVKIAFFRIAQEALNNVVKHARAHNVWVDLYCNDNILTLSIRDDGRGFELDQDHRGQMGLDIMRERALTIGADLEVRSRTGQGTELWLVYQVEASQ